ncbi:MAG: hypothetical protein OXE84_05555 [Rhodobacteraceae bacterium]|nr:hypothetical protein [Paracoccaceae bacterium]MCY4197795.1 hypothetical protein [Paracoccaceae bacterium]MCY4326549.1 hypothetical protein [Paracoccaceae bacterium]
MNATNNRPEIRLKPSDYQPSKSELEADVRIDASPEDVIRAAFQQVRPVEDKHA